VLKRGQDLLRYCQGDDACIVQDKLTALENRYDGKEIQVSQTDIMLISYT